jgi:hypothetical protein
MVTLCDGFGFAWRRFGGGGRNDNLFFSSFVLCCFGGVWLRETSRLREREAATKREREGLYVCSLQLVEVEVQ